MKRDYQNQTSEICSKEYHMWRKWGNFSEMSDHLIQFCFSTALFRLTKLSLIKALLAFTIVVSGNTFIFCFQLFHSNDVDKRSLQDLFATTIQQTLEVCRSISHVYFQMRPSKTYGPLLNAIGNF